MRGDSLRDLYAKTLALLGLGVLAGAGALVDYWPVGVNLPDAGSALDLPALARPIAVSDQQSARVARRESAPRRLVLADRVSSPAVFYASLPVVAVSDSGLGEPVGLPAPVTRSAMAFTAASFEGPDALSDGYEPHLTLGSAAEATLPAPVSTSANAETDGFITGAFKKTGSSIVRTGVKTGSSIVDAVRVVGGAVRKALPN